MKQQAHIIKIGGNVLDDPALLSDVLDDFAAHEGSKILVHGGGKLATQLSAQLGIETIMLNGRRVTDRQTLDVVTMVYAGLVNKNIVAGLQARGCNALGICGADANIIPASKRNPEPVDFGFVGDVRTDDIRVDALEKMLSAGFCPIVAPLTHDGKGQLLNTNADTIASCLAIALAGKYDTHLVYCFEKKGVLRDISDENSVIPRIGSMEYEELKAKSIISDGMLPKLDNAFAAIGQGVISVSIGHARHLKGIIKQEAYAATRLTA